MADLTVSPDIDTLLQSGSNAAARINLGLLSAATTASTDYATAAQGATADSALQNGDTFDELIDGTTNKAFTATEQTKLAGIAAGAEVNTIESIVEAGMLDDTVVLNVVSVSQANYAAGTKIGTTLYIIT